jgi:hypothetical protein
MTTMYGWVENLETQAMVICDCLGHGQNGTATDLLVETTAVETGCGHIKDRTEGAGMGLTQFDEMAFNDIKHRSMAMKEHIINRLGIDIALVQWTDLRYNPYLALLFTRLHYRLRPEPIPATRSQRAEYWKQWYNTKIGAGTPEHYLKMCDIYLT